MQLNIVELHCIGEEVCSGFVVLPCRFLKDLQQISAYGNIMANVLCFGMALFGDLYTKNAIADLCFNFGGFDVLGQYKCLLEFCV